ncbi:electron transport complex subunit RsxC [Lacticigenium naphthae]|uniref:electron transport complex subunit RsxC n=1 Tax=Lacticigenium naphthae TaxID=515351 RepID=UPI0003FA370C|nr:electron transport complex subunit RsxC [Lacticigenium naphthae]
MRFSFKGKQGGSHPDENKERTANLPIVEAEVPRILVFPTTMHIGAPANPVVEVGDKVKIGTVLAEAAGKISAAIHSSVSGEVVAIEKRQTVNGLADCIVVQNNQKDEKDAPIINFDQKLTKEFILDAVRKAGIVGMGGAAFPTSVKLDSPPGSTIDTLIINGAECESYSTSDHRVMIESSDEIIQGIQVLRHLFPHLKSIVIGIEDNKPEAIDALEIASSEYADISIHSLRTRYPEGSEKNLIQNITGREVPPGELPVAVHCVVLNTSTTLAIYRATTFGEPLYQRVVSVSGTPVVEPKNLLVRIGTPVEFLIEQCGGFNTLPGKLLSGGPMMGKTLADGSEPIIKGTTSITALTPEEAEVGDSSDCIMCSECVNVCPVSLQPILISDAFERGNIEKAKKLGAMDCIECGNCSYICPSKISLLENIRSAKALIKAEQNKAG